MKKLKQSITIVLSLCLTLSFVLGTFFIPPTPAAATQGRERRPDGEGLYVEDEVLVKYKKDRINLETQYGKMASAFLSVSRATVKKEDIEEGNVSVIEIRDDKTVEQKIAELRADPAVEYAEPNYRYEPTAILSNDTHRALLWGLDNTGQAIKGKQGMADADIDAPDAWEINAGTNGSAIVAVIDTGVHYTHPDLAAQMWDGTQCVNEDGVPLGGCLHGYDFELNDKNPDPADWRLGYDKREYYLSHGTHVAGTIAAARDNNRGIIGVAPRAKIMAIKSSLTSNEVVKSIDFARQNGARVINASFGGPGFSQATFEAIGRFRSAGGVFVAAVGNSKSNTDTLPHYPSGYDLDNIIAVAATDNKDALASFSNFGATSVDVGAPGVDIYSTIIPASTIINDSTVMNETFEGVVPPNMPDGWSKTGAWGTAALSSETVSGTVLFGDAQNKPYAKTANTLATAPVVNLSGASTTKLTFFSRCDTEYQIQYTDYMILEVSADGALFTEILRWDEFDLDADDDTSGSAEDTVTASIPSQYMTGSFQFRFRWIANGNDDTGSNGEGCFIDNLQLIKQKKIFQEENYDFYSGTSMASPHVAGLAALIRGYKQNLTAAQVRSAILSTGDLISALQGKTVTGKRINAHKALQSLTPTLTAFAFSSLNATGLINQTEHTITVVVPFNTDVTALVPTIAFTGISVFPASGVAQNFTNPVVYTVTASDDSVQSYSVSIIKATVVLPTLTVSRDASSPPASQAVAGTASTQGALIVRLEASTVEDIGVDDITFATLSNTHDIAVASATLWRADSADGPWTQVAGNAIFNQNGTAAGFIRWQLEGADRITLPKSSVALLKFAPAYGGSGQVAISGVQPVFALTSLHAIGAVSLAELIPNVGGIVGNPTTLLDTKLTVTNTGSPAGSTTGATGKEVFRVVASSALNSSDPAENKATITRIDFTNTKSGASVANLVMYPSDHDLDATYRTTCSALSATEWRCTLATAGGTNEVVEGASRTYIVRGDVGFAADGSVEFSIANLGTADAATNDVSWTDGTTALVWIDQPVKELKASSPLKNPSSTSASGMLDTARPTITSLVFTSLDAPNKVSAGDTITITFSETMDPSDIMPGFIPGGLAVPMADGATGDVSLAKTTGVMTIVNIASVDIDGGDTPTDTTYTTSAAFNAGGTILTIMLDAKNSGSGLLSGSMMPGTVSAIETQISDVNGNLLAPSAVTASAIPHPAAKKITAFTFAAPAVAGSIDEQKSTIALTVPFGVAVTALVPNIDILGASLQPASGVAKDFTNPVVYTVMAQDGSTRQYTVTVNVVANTAKDITAFTISLPSGEYQGVIDEGQQTINAIVSHGANVTALSPTIAISGASVSPASGAVQDFTAPVIYIVTAQNGSTKQYVVTVTASQKPAITAFTVLSIVPGSTPVAGVIDELAHTITVSFPFGADVSNLVATIAFTGSAINPQPGPILFQQQTIYTVTAQDRSTQSYTVFMNSAKNSAKKITSFTFASPLGAGVIKEEKHAIIFVAPSGTDVTALMPTIMMTGASIVPPSGAAQNFTNPVTYTVTAEDGTTQTYTVMVKVLAPVQIIPNEKGEASITKEKPHVVVISPTQDVVVIVDQEAKDPAIDFGTLISSGAGVLPKTTIHSAAVSVAIPAATTVTSANASWDGALKAPTQTTNVTLPQVSGQTLVLASAIDVGSSDTKLSFNKAVRLLLQGKAGKRAGYVQQGGVFTEITTTCLADDQATGDALPSDGECKIDAGSELVIWTKHFTTFAAYTQTQNQSSGGGGGGGGGGSSGGGGGGGGSSVPPAPRPAPPAGGFSVAINNGDAMTNNAVVELMLNAGADTSFMLIANTEDFEGANKEAYAAKKAWVLTDSMGTKNVYVKFLHADGSASPIIFDSILYLYLTPPKEDSPALQPLSIQPNTLVVLPQVLGTKVSRDPEKPRPVREPSALARRLSGRILLQVQERGEAWYVYPDNKQRYYLGRPHDAFTIMRALGLGAKHDFIVRTIHYPQRLWGKILLDVEMNGEAYYINPTDARAYYLGRPHDAFEIMRRFGLGITNANLEPIDIAVIK